MNQAAATPTTLDSIMQSLDMMIQKTDPERIQSITKYMQAIVPTDNAKVTLRAGSNDEDKRAALTFFVKQVNKAEQSISLNGFFQSLLQKVPLEDVEHLGRVLAHLESFDGSEFDFDFIVPHFSEGAGHVCHFFIYKQ